MNIKVCNSTTLPNRSSPSKETHASLQTASHISEDHTATHSCLTKQYNTLFVLGDEWGSGVSPQLPQWMRGVSAQDPHAPQTSTQTRDWHHEGKSLKFVSVLLERGGGFEKKKKKFSFLGFRALTCWGGPQVLTSASHHHSQQN